MNYFLLLFVLFSGVCNASFVELDSEEMNIPTKTIGEMFLMNPDSELSSIEGPDRVAAVHQYLKEKISIGNQLLTEDENNSEMISEDSGLIFMEAGESCHWLGHIYSELKYKLFESDQLIWYETTLELHQKSLEFYQAAARYGVLRAKSLNGANPVPILHASEHIDEAKEKLGRVSVPLSN